MKRSVKELYQAAIRFDEGEIYQSQDYNTVLKNKNHLRRTIQTLFGAVVSPLVRRICCRYWGRDRIGMQTLF